MTSIRVRAGAFYRVSVICSESPTFTNCPDIFLFYVGSLKYSKLVCHNINYFLSKLLTRLVLVLPVK